MSKVAKASTAHMAMQAWKEAAFCRSCGEPIYWLKHQRTGKLAPIEVRRDPDGNVLASPDYGTYCIANADERRAYREWLHANHFARCPNAKGHAKTTGKTTGKTAPAAAPATVAAKRGQP